MEAAWALAPKGPAPAVSKWKDLPIDKLDPGIGPKMSVAVWLKNGWAKHLDDLRVQADVESGRALAPNPENWIYDAHEGGFRRRLGDRSFGTAVTTHAFKMLFVHLTDRKMHFFLTQIPKIEAHRPIFSSKEALVKAGERLVLNTYIPTTLVPQPGDWSCYERLVRHLVGDREESYLHFMQTLAAPLQSLHRSGRPRTLGFYQLVFGHPGCGKDTLADVLRLMYGDENYQKLDQDAIDSRFNSQIRGKLLLHLNETISSTNRTMESANKIKEMTTASRLDIEGKGKDRETIEVFHNMYVTSNSERPVLLEHWDRRANPYYVKSRLPGSLAHEIYADLGSPAGTGPLDRLRAFFHHLLYEVNVTLKFGERDPDNDIQIIIDQSLSPQQAFVEKIRRHGWLEVAAEFNELPGLGRWTQPFETVKQVPVVDAAFVYEVFERWCRANGHHNVPPKRAVKGAFAMMLNGAFAESRSKRKDRTSFDAWHGIPLEGSEAVHPEDDNSSLQLLPLN